MLISKAILEKSTDDATNKEVYTTLNWNIIESLIRKLDGEDYTELELILGDGSEMLLTGGWQNRYLCQIFVDGDFSSVLIDNNMMEGDDIAIDKYEYDIIPAYHTNDLNKVLQACKTYCESGIADQTLSWES